MGLVLVLSSARLDGWLPNNSMQPTALRAAADAERSTVRGVRHEFVSVRLFEQAGSAVADGINLELARFLIGTHHGFGRPFAPVVQDNSPVDVKMTHDGQELVVSSDHRLHRLDGDWADLFWSLIRRFGWWGLAYLEALLITADRRVSAREQTQSGAAAATP